MENDCAVLWSPQVGSLPAHETHISFWPQRTLASRLLQPARPSETQYGAKFESEAKNAAALPIGIPDWNHLVIDPFATSVGWGMLLRFAKR
jgi:hypothetical protein